jgi:hypothetical protein
MSAGNLRAWIFLAVVVNGHHIMVALSLYLYCAPSDARGKSRFRRFHGESS